MLKNKLISIFFTIMAIMALWKYFVGPRGENDSNKEEEF